MDNYKYMEISKFWLILWIIVGIIFSISTKFLIFIVPVCYYFILNSCKYYYNDEKLIIEIGVLKKEKKIVPLYRIVNITAQDNIFNFGKIYIKDKEQIVVLKYVKHSKDEMMKLIEKWENAKKQNIRNEVI